MDGFRIDPTAPQPPSAQVIDALLDALAAGRFETGQRLPSVRTLAAELAVNTNTVGRVYAELERLGVVAGRRGSGIYVAPGARPRARRIRLAATLAGFRRAAEQAVRAGHPRDSLATALEATADATNRTTELGTP